MYNFDYAQLLQLHHITQRYVNELRLVESVVISATELLVFASGYKRICGAKFIRMLQLKLNQRVEIIRLKQLLLLFRTWHRHQDYAFGVAFSAIELQQVVLIRLLFGII